MLYLTLKKQTFFTILLSISVSSDLPPPPSCLLRVRVYHSDQGRLLVHVVDERRRRLPLPVLPHVAMDRVRPATRRPRVVPTKEGGGSGVECGLSRYAAGSLG